MPQQPPVTLVQKIVDRLAENAPAAAPCSGRIPVSAYTDQDRFEQEKQLFMEHPLIIGHQSQLPEVGDAMVQDWLGLPLITLRDKAGEIATFMNVCRHRGMRLVETEGKTRLRSLVCPYHQWTYGLDGSLRNIPRQESFLELNPQEMGLVPVSTTVRHGLIWMQARGTPDMDIDTHLAGLGADLDVFRMGDLHFCQQSVKTVNCNWKLVQDAFLDGYHVTRLHKNTVGAFFPDAVSESDTIGHHIRSAVARNEIVDAADLPVEALDLRHHVTFSYTVFPSAILVFHPEYTSIIGLFPQSPDQTVFTHTMLTTKPAASEDERDHFLRSFELIDEGVFAAEDLFVCQSAQRGMLSGANEALLFGGLEEAAIRFHNIIERKLGSRGNSLWRLGPGQKL
jgi:Rieske 2Fe-2S family protein